MSADRPELAREMLRKIDEWDALWEHRVKLPIDRDEARLLRMLLRDYLGNTICPTKP